MQTDGLWCRVVGRMEILPISGSLSWCSTALVPSTALKLVCNRRRTQIPGCCFDPTLSSVTVENCKAHSVDEVTWPCMANR
jgi:hypothetical protein